MGVGIFGRSCYTNSEAPAPNPNPSRWTLLQKAVHKNGYVLKVQYHDCTNFEGVKILVFEGKYSLQLYLDPHFNNTSKSPIARFRPDEDGWERAVKLARSL